jgi:hypothetical protein
MSKQPAMIWELQFQSKQMARIVLREGYKPGLVAVCGYLDWLTAQTIVEAHNRDIERLRGAVK